MDVPFLIERLCLRVLGSADQVEEPRCTKSVKARDSGVSNVRVVRIDRYAQPGEDNRRPKIDRVNRVSIHQAAQVASAANEARGGIKYIGVVQSAFAVF